MILWSTEICSSTFSSSSSPPPKKTISWPFTTAFDSFKVEINRIRFNFIFHVLTLTRVSDWLMIRATYAIILLRIIIGEIQRNISISGKPRLVTCHKNQTLFLCIHFQKVIDTKINSRLRNSLNALLFKKHLRPKSNKNISILKGSFHLEKCFHLLLFTFGRAINLIFLVEEEAS